MIEEIYKDIPDFEGYYQASNLGNIKRLAIGLVKQERVMRPMDNGNGYLNIPLCKNGTKRRYYVHRLVASAFHGANKTGLEVNHYDGNKYNNTPENLSWTTRAENQKHRYDVLGHHGANKGRCGDKMWTSKPVLMYDLNGNFIQRFASMREASQKTEISDSCIRSASCGKQKSAGGYLWERELVCKTKARW
jgi:hypothetical protein